MKIYEEEIVVPRASQDVNLIEYFKIKILKQLGDDKLPIRFVVTKTERDKFFCELGIISDTGELNIPWDTIFRFRKRQYEDTKRFNAVLIVPTGIGAEIGGHSGDAGPAARLLSVACDTLITHPNVVNASDINELPENGLYVEGSVLTRLLMGTVGLQPIRSNRVIVIIDKKSPFHEQAINMAGAARASFGLDCPLAITMDSFPNMRFVYANSGRATGKIQGIDKLINILKERINLYDAIALTSVIEIPDEIRNRYYSGETSIINPWGGVEAMLTHTLSTIFNVPSAHCPMLPSREILNMELGVVDPRQAAEDVSITYLFSVFKGLHKSPRIITDSSLLNSQNIISAKDISCVIIPDKCLGLPTLAAIDQEIPVIAVRENNNIMQNALNDLPFATNKFFRVKNYWEAVGVMQALRAGIEPMTVRRPIAQTNHKNYT